ncbi:MAG: DUF1080 domain-containing protein [Opitutaceae bacterium]|nr:DUF1080 domain-containing protein [Opitutaceae bacterium]
MMTSHPRSLRHALAGVVIALLGALALPPALAGDAVRPAAATALFNGRDLAGWTVVGKDGDPAALATWTVRDGVLTASGSPYGYLRTDRAYRDYVLRVEWRWVPGAPPVEANGKPRGRNSGVLLHMHGDDKVWPGCLEAQLQEGNAGDFIAMAPAIVFDELTAFREKSAAAAGADEAAKQRALTARRIARQHESSEKPVGEWNTYEIVCRDASVTLTVNGVLQNTATGLTVTEGTIALQSEGMPIEFRRVELAPLAP